MKKLYESLCAQTRKDFEWFVVDDGSSDGTGQIVKQMATEADFEIRYLYKENGGKHTALNLGIQKIESELTFIVDSDDILTKNAVETIYRYHERYKDEENLCGYVFLKKFPNGKINGKKFVPSERVASYIDVRINENDTMADKAEVFFTNCLKEFPFPEFAGEKFLGEDAVWISLGLKYKMVHINKAIYIAEYLDDGLSKNRRKHNIESPLGCMYRAKQFMRGEINWKYRVKGALQYIIYGKFAGYGLGALVKDIPNKKLVIAAIIPGVLLHEKWKWEYKKR